MAYELDLGPMLSGVYEAPTGAGGVEPDAGSCGTGTSPEGAGCLVLGWTPASGQCNPSGNYPKSGACFLGNSP